MLRPLSFNKNEEDQKMMAALSTMQQRGQQDDTQKKLNQRIAQQLLQTYSPPEQVTLENLGQGFEEGFIPGVVDSAAQIGNYLINNPQGKQISAALLADSNPYLAQGLYQSGLQDAKSYAQAQNQAGALNQRQTQLGMQYLKDQNEAKRAERSELSVAQKAKEKRDFDATQKDLDRKNKMAIAQLKKKDKSPTESQAKDNLFYNRTQLAENELKKLENEGYDFTSWKRNPFTQKGRRFEQAKQNFLTATLRDLSGAAIGKDEYAREEKIYFPQRGDSDEVIEQKRIARQVAIDGLKEGSGPAFKDLINIEQTTDTVKSGGKTLQQMSTEELLEQL
tara:strand:- start:10482 stop:11486 length:1005 start_codon:yes stop_codon:yes gene_type:complete